MADLSNSVAVAGTPGLAARFDHCAGVGRAGFPSGGTLPALQGCPRSRILLERGWILLLGRSRGIFVLGSLHRGDRGTLEKVAGCCDRPGDAGGVVSGSLGLLDSGAGPPTFHGV